MAGFLAPYAYDLWNSTLEYLRVLADPGTAVDVLRKELPSVAALVSDDDNDDEESYSMRDIQPYVLPVYNKMLQDTSGRMVHSLNLMRACRLFNYTIVGAMDLSAVKAEMTWFSCMPPCLPLKQLLMLEVGTYHRIAVAEAVKPADQQLSLWAFWQSNTQALPSLHHCFREGAALVPTSSGSIEQGFSFLEGAISEQ